MAMSILKETKETITITFNNFLYYVDMIYKSPYSSEAYAFVHDKNGTKFMIDYDSKYTMIPIDISIAMIQ